MHKIYVFILLSLMFLLNGCAIYDTLTCADENWVSRSDILDGWVGQGINQYERQYGVQPTDSMSRPQNRIRYQYRVMSGYNGPDYWYCDDTITVDNDTGKIVNWSYEGNNCAFESYCAN